MGSLITVSKAQEKLAEHLRAQRLALGLTQAGLAERSGVSLPTLRKFEQKGLISLESFLKLSMALGSLEKFVAAAEPITPEFSSIEDVLEDKKPTLPKRGWRK
ncbi:helix-turn-helix transcriptional regulator [Parvibaculaceae bacterium PLY_AMNH_Bact1]|nr:helix-turn-helix transcriptional regulator [Parvibaculaceae bacterium PLY_AMNH_Bact1]